VSEDKDEAESRRVGLSGVPRVSVVYAGMAFTVLREPASMGEKRGVLALGPVGAMLLVVGVPIAASYDGGAGSCPLVRGSDHKA
jgi:hypothetical protein